MPKVWKPNYHLKVKTYAVICLSSLVILAWTASKASHHTLANWENSLFDFIYGWNEQFRPLFLALTQLGSAWMVLIVPLFIWAQKQRRLAWQLFLGGVLAFLLVEWLKYLVARPRPVYLRSDIMQRESFITGFGFPSGHTAIATVLALMLLPYVPRRQWWLLAVWVILVGLSRLYLGVHAPLDIAGGLAIGTFVASSFHAFDKVRVRIVSRRA
jgi:undecaprenyl-diphosphatase